MISSGCVVVWRKHFLPIIKVVFTNDLFIIVYWLLNCKVIITECLVMISQHRKALLPNNYFHYLLTFKNVEYQQSLLLSLVVALSCRDHWFCRRWTGTHYSERNEKISSWKSSNIKLFFVSLESCLNFPTILINVATIPVTSK